MRKTEQKNNMAQMTEETRNVNGKVYTFKKAYEVLLSEAKRNAFNTMLSEANRLNNCTNGFTYRAQTPPKVNTNSNYLTLEQMRISSLYVRKSESEMEKLAVVSDMIDLGKDGISIIFTAANDNYKDLAKKLVVNYCKNFHSDVAEVWEIPFSVSANGFTVEDLQKISKQVTEFLGTDM